jgi:hypothetical protein
MVGKLATVPGPVNHQFLAGFFVPDERCIKIIPTIDLPENACLQPGHPRLNCLDGYYEDCFRRLEWRALYEFRRAAGG